MKCLKVDDQSYVITFGDFDSVPDGMFRVSDSLSLPPGHMRVKYIDGEFVQTNEPVFGAPSVSMMRSAQYPSIGDQLGALWKAIAPLIEHPEAAEVLAKIQAVKDANPKG